MPTPHRSSVSGSPTGGKHNQCGSFFRYHHNRPAYRKLPQVRTSKKSVSLPYRLGNLSHFQHKVVDVQLSLDWLTAPDFPRRACAFARLVCRLVPDQTCELQLQNREDRDTDVWCRRRRNQRCSRISLLEPSTRAFHHQRAGVCLLSPGQPNETSLSLGHPQWARQLAEALPSAGLRGVVRAGFHAARTANSR